MRTRALDIAVGQKPVIIDRENLFLDALLDQALLFENSGEMLGQFDIGRVRCTAEIIETQRETLARRHLDVVLFVAIGLDIDARGGCGQLGRRAVFVGGADIEHIMSAKALEASINIRRQHGSSQIAEVFHTVDVRQGAGDQDTGHCETSSFGGEFCALFRLGREPGELAGKRAYIAVL